MLHYCKLTSAKKNEGREGGIKEDTGKSMKHALYVLQMLKGTSRAEAASSSKKNLACSLSGCRLCLSI